MPTISQLEQAIDNAERAGRQEDVVVLRRELSRALYPKIGREPRRSKEELLEQERRYLLASGAPQAEPGMFTNFTRGIGAGAVGVGELAALGAATLLEEEEELAARQKIQSVAEALRPERGDPDSISYKLGSGLGSIAGIAAPAVAAAFAPVSAPVAAGIGIGGGAALGVGAGAGEASERARAADATEEERSTATLRGAAIGSLEVTPLGRIFRRLPKIGELFAKGGDEVKENVGALRRIAETGGKEGLQEAAAGILQNLNERGYNVERELVDAGVLEEGAIGAGSGAILQGIVELFTRGKSRGAPVTEESPATEEEIVEEEQLLGLPAPDPDELVQVRMPDGSVQEVRASDLESARRKEQEALKERDRQRAKLDTQMDAIQRVEREDAQQRQRERGVDLPESEVRAAEEPRARARAQDEQIDAFTLEREIESAQPRREIPKPEPTEQMGLPIERAERDQIQREMFGPRGGIPKRAKEEPKPEPRRAEQQLSLDLPQEQQALIGPKGGIPRRRKEPFREPVAKPATQEPAPQADVLTKERLDALGIASSVQKIFVNKDVNKPETQRRLRNFARGKKGSEQARANVTRLLDGTSERQTDLFSETGPRASKTRVRNASVAEPQQATSGDGVSDTVSTVGSGTGVSATESSANISGKPEGRGVGDVGRSTGEPVRGAVAEQPTLETPVAPAQAKKPTAPKQVTQKTTTPPAPAEQKKKVKAAPKKEAPKKTKLGDDPEVRARLDTLKKDLEDEPTFKRYSSPNTNTIPDDADPTTDKDNKIVANKLKVGTQKNREDVAVEAYLGRRERVIDGLDAAIYDLVVGTNIDKNQTGRSEADKKFFAGTSGTRRKVKGKEETEPSSAERVVAWAEKNLGKETQQWMKKRRAQLETKDRNLTAKREKGKDAVVTEREADKAKASASTERASVKAELETYAQDDAFMTPAERRRAKRVMDAIDDFDDDMPYELRTGDTVLGMEIHPAAVAALRDGDIAGALRIVAASPNKDVARFAGAFAKNIGDTKVKFFSSTAEDSLAGSFDPKTNTINLNTANGISQHTLLHEVGHALTSATLAKPSHPLTKQLTTLYNDVKDVLGTAYGTKNLDEFVSEAESNPEFRAELAGINPDGSDINALQRYTNSVGNFLRRLVGMKTKDIESAQTRADSLINEILAPAPEYRDANILAMSSTAAGVKKVMSAMGSVQKGINKNNPLTEKGRKEFGQSYKQFRDIVGEEYGNIPLKFFDMSAAVDAARATNEKLGTVAQKALVAMERMRGASAQRDEATHDAIQPMERWFDNASPEETKLFNDIIYSREYGATIFQVDPTLSRADAKKKYEGKPVDGNDLWAIWQENQKQWNKLANTGGQKVYKDMQAFYKKQFEELKQVLFSRIETMADGDAQTVAKLKTEFEKRLFDKKGMDVYFPLIREGKYKIGYRYKPGKTPKGQDNFVFEIHQNRSDWLTQLREIESSPDMELVRSSDNENFRDYADKAPSSSFVNQTLQLLRGSKVDEATQEAFMRMVVTTLPESSLARALQSRKNTAGHETDALYAIKTKGFDIGRQVERLKFSASMQNVLSDLEGVAATEKNKFSSEEEWKLTQSVKDIQDRMQFAMGGAEYKNVEGIVRVANQTAFLFTIGFNTASAIVQTAQIPMVVMPMMMAKYGVKPTLEAMYRAMRIVMSARNHRPELAELSKLKGKRVAQKATDLADKFSPAYGLDAYYKREGDKFVVRNDIELTNAEIKELKDLAPLVKEASDRGHLNRSFMADALGLLEGGKTKRNDSAGQKILSGLDTGTAISAMMFNQAERFNRQVSMLLSYDLAKQDAKNKGKSIDEGVLIENAFRETHQLNGGSTLETAPPILRENIGRMAGMYKSYGMRMYTTMFNVGATALGQYSDMLKAQGVPDAEIKERVSIARKQSLGILGSSLFFSGVSGVPIYGAIELAVDAFKDDEDDDFNTIVRDYVGEGWYKGAVNQILSEAGVGIDVASRIRLTGLLIQANRYNTNPSVEETIGFYMGGPALSVGKRLLRGKDDILEGEFQRGVENLLPVGISNALKVLGRYQQDGGVYSRRGDPIYDDITGGELVGQFFGFAPSEYTRIQENNQRVKRIDTALSRKASTLRKKYYLATRQKDYSSARKVLQEIAEYNRAHPNFAITQDSIDRSMKQHMKTSTEMYNGVTLSPAMRRLLDDQLEAERNGFVAPK